LVGVNYSLVNIDFGSVLEGLSSFRRARAELTFRDIVEAADMPAADLAHMAMENEQLCDLLATGLELGARTRLEKKRRALGAIVGRAFVHPNDSAIVDEAQLLLRAVGPLDAPHVMALARLHEGHRSGTAGLADDEVTDAELDEVIQPVAARQAVVASLDNLGLALSSRSKGASTSAFQSGRADICQITDFGRRMLQFLQLEDGEPLPDDG
jgi:hypothetical protein